MTKVSAGRARGTFVRVLVGLVLVATLAALAWLWNARRTPPAICETLRLARIASVLLAEPARLDCEGVQTRELESLLIGAAFAAPHEKPASELLFREKATAVGLLPGHKYAGVLGQLGGFEHVPGLRGVVLSPEFAAFQSVREPTLTAVESDAIAYVARALFRGAREPVLSSFPASLRKVERVEVIVTLSDNGRPILWRSTRGTSIARAMLTATRVARDRWHESAQSKGGPLEKRLPALDVEVGILAEDGTLTSLTPTFVNRAITRAHGIGIDYRNGWHYFSPADVATRGKGKPFAALEALLADQGLHANVLKDPNLRVYRFVALALGVSKAPLRGAAAGD